MYCTLPPSLRFSPGTSKPEREGLDLPKKVRIFAGEAVEGFSETEAVRLRAEAAG